ncbi:MAG TPA: lysophospholipid acyltransferase family protein [Bryobacteraceae bacterium]|nr:lysophospholipid acyltransferase family protein [Bryobacteraceae bacterium]
MNKRARSPLRNRFEFVLAQAIVVSLEKSPRAVADRLGDIYARVLDRAIPRLRRIAERNLSFAYPECDTEWRAQTIDGVFASIGRLLVAFARFPLIGRANVTQWIRYEGFEHYERAKELGKGVLFATAHLGNWELSAFAHALLAEPMNVVVRPLDNPLIDGLVERRRAMSGNTLLSKRDFARSILQALRANQPVGILVDQNTSAENGAFVPFFGQLACANLTFAKLAARSGAAVIPGFAIWSKQERRYVLRFYRAIEMTGDAPADTARIQAALEAAIREYPDQWLWIHRRWKTRPTGAPGLYD